MAWSEHIHIHNHINYDCNKEVLELLREIKELLTNTEDAVLRQKIMDKLNKLNDDIKSTIE